MINYFCKDTTQNGVWALGVSANVSLYRQLSDMARLSYNLLRSNGKNDSYYPHSISCPSNAVWYYTNKEFIEGMKGTLNHSETHRQHVFNDEDILKITPDDARQFFNDQPKVFLEDASRNIFDRLPATSFNKSVYGEYAIANGHLFVRMANRGSESAGISFESYYHGNLLTLEDVASIEDTRVSFYYQDVTSAKILTSPSFKTARIMRLIEQNIGDAMGIKSNENDNN